MTSLARHFAAVACGFALTLGAVAAFNAKLDTAGLYLRHVDDVPALAGAYAERLLRASDGEGLVAWSAEREVKLELARRADADCYVLGSSHVVSIRRDGLTDAGTCRALVNLGVSGGSIEDFLILLAQVAEHPQTRRVYLGLAPWSLKWGVDKRWQAYAHAAGPARELFALPASRLDAAAAEQARYLNLINLGYFLRNVQSLWQYGVGGPPPLTIEPAAQAGEGRAVTRPDGSHRYAQTYLRTMPPPRHLVGDGRFDIAKPFLAPDAVEVLGRVVETLRRRDIETVFLLTPYHPKVWDCANAMVCQALEQVEAQVRRLAGQHAVKVVGSYRPAPFGLGDADFHDDMHLAPSAIARLGVIAAPH